MFVPRAIRQQFSIQFYNRRFCETLATENHTDRYCSCWYWAIKTHLKYRIHLKLGPRHNAFQINADCMLINKITEPLSGMSITRSSLVIPKNLKPADPDFHVTSGIDLLIGAKIF